jgi:hypothetical protein
MSPASGSFELLMEEKLDVGCVGVFLRLVLSSTSPIIYQRKQLNNNE